MPKTKSSSRRIYLIAAIAAIIIAAIYIYTGQAKLDQNRQQLLHSEEVTDVQTSNQDGARLVTVTCDDGREYEIFYPPGSTDFETLKSSKCN